jgi:protein-L-isoaspartate(D-aspartate) O-methyltransferase
MEAPFQFIHVGAAAPSIPEPLIDQVRCPALLQYKSQLIRQLARPGRMFIPVGQDSQGKLDLTLGSKADLRYMADR